MPARVTEDEIDKKMQEIKDLRRRGASMDATSVKGLGADQHAKWVNRKFNDGERIQHFENNGYKLAKATKDGKGIRATVGRVTETNEIVNGNSILMVTDRDNYVERLAKAKLKGRSAEEAFHNQKAEKMRQIARDEYGVGVEITNTSRQGPDVVRRRGASAADDDD